MVGGRWNKELQPQPPVGPAKGAGSMELTATWVKARLQHWPPWDPELLPSLEPPFLLRNGIT